VVVYITLSTLFMMDSVSAPLRTAQFISVVTLSALVREMPADPAREAEKTARRAEINTIVFPSTSSRTDSQRSTAFMA
jgi:hypothetical protein